jgi:hypothetical protein
MNMEYPKSLLKQCGPWFSWFNGFLKKIKLIWNNIIMKKNYYNFTLYYNEISFGFKKILNI